MSDGSGPGVLNGIVGQLTALVSPLSEAVADGAAGVQRLGAALGYSISDSDAGLIAQAFGALEDPLANGGSGGTNSLSGLISEIQSAVQDPSKIVALLGAVRSLFNSVSNLEADLSDLPGLPQALLDYLVCSYLKNYWPWIYGPFVFLGVISDAGATPPAGSPRYTIAWSNIPQLFSNPDYFQTLYQWGTESFQAGPLINGLAVALGAIGLPILIEPPSAPGAPSNLLVGVDASTPDQPLLVGVEIQPLPATSLGTDAGVALVPQLPSAITLNTGPWNGWSAGITIGAFGQSGYGLWIRPTGVKFVQISSGSASSGSGWSASASATKVNSGGGPIAIFGDPNSVGLQATSLGLTIGLQSGGIAVGVSFQGLQLTINPAGLDGFLAALLGNSPQTINLSCGLQWSSQNGFSFTGGSSIQVTIPLHESLGPVDVDSISVGLTAGATGIELTVTASGGVTLGPVSAEIDKVGVSLGLAPVSQGQPAGFLGGFDLQAAFAPPTGLGLAVDAGPISGGGFISFDPASGEYAGIASLAIDIPVLTLDIDVIGLLDTKLPGGVPKYSFLIIVTAQFPPIQLGFGFTLNGLGGLAGIGRTVNPAALQAAVLGHTLDNILFPTDPVANATQIESEVSSIFPVAAGNYVFGPLLELGWGDPQIVDAELGIVLSIPQPIIIALIGNLAAGLPDIEEPDDAIVLIQVQIEGTIDFGTKQLLITAVLYDSHVLTFNLTGGLGLMVNWGDTPFFCLSVGGFNPKFATPAGFPSLPRVGISLAQDGSGISLNAYFAVTSNSFQVGAQLDINASAAGFSLQGQLGFDALFIFKPFSFQVDIFGNVSILQGSSVLFALGLDLNLSGPQPWQASGSVTFKLWIFGITIPFSITIGSPASAAPIPSVAVLPQLGAQVGTPANWSAVLPSGVNPVCSFRKVAPPSSGGGPQAVAVHPSGSLTFRQTYVPLETTLDQVAGATPSDVNNAWIALVTLGSGSVSPPASGASSSQWTPTLDNFARAQFQDQTDDQKLSDPSYEEMPSGVTVSAAGFWVSPDTAQATITYSVFLVENPATPGIQASSGITPTPAEVQAFAPLGASYSPQVRTRGSAKYSPVAPQTSTSPSATQYVIATVTSLTVRTDILAAPTTQIAAQAALNAYLAAHPAETATLQVVASYIPGGS